MDSASKRLSTSGSRGYRDALSNNGNKSSSPGPTSRSSDLDGQLRNSIGTRVKITTTAQKTIEGTVFTFSPNSNILAVDTGSTASSSGSTYHFIPSSQIVSMTTISEKDAEATTPLPQLDLQALKHREAAAIEKIQAADQKRGKGVTKEAQELFNHFDRIIPSFWDNKSIIVNNNVRIDPPYGVDDCKAPKDSKQAEAQIRKMLEGYYAKKRDGGRETPSGGVKPVVPALPRKGG